MSQNMSSFVYMLSKTKGIYYTTEFVNHGSVWTADMDIKVTKYKETMRRNDTKWERKSENSVIKSLSGLGGL